MNRKFTLDKNDYFDRKEFSREITRNNGGKTKINEKSNKNEEYQRIWLISVDCHLLRHILLGYSSPISNTFHHIYRELLLPRDLIKPLIQKPPPTMKKKKKNNNSQKKIPNSRQPMTFVFQNVRIATPRRAGSSSATRGPAIPGSSRTPSAAAPRSYTKATTCGASALPVSTRAPAAWNRPRCCCFHLAWARSSYGPMIRSAAAG